MARIELGFSCSEDWNGMELEGRGVRRCGACGEKVVDLSRLTRRDAVRLVAKNDGTCVSFETDRAGDVVFRAELRRAPGAVVIGAAALLAACTSEEPAFVELAPDPATTTEPVIVMMPMSTPGAPVVTPIPLAADGDVNDVDSAPSTVGRPRTSPSHPAPAATIRRRYAGRRPAIVSVRRDRNI